MLDVELNEKLKRQSEELQVKLERLGEADTGNAFSVEDFEARSRELKGLNASIVNLQKRASGKLIL